MTVQQRFILSGRFECVRISGHVAVLQPAMWVFLHKWSRCCLSSPFSHRSRWPFQKHACLGQEVCQKTQSGMRWKSRHSPVWKGPTVLFLLLFGASACDLWADTVSAQCRGAATVTDKKEVPTVSTQAVNLHYGLPSRQRAAWEKLHIYSRFWCGRPAEVEQQAGARTPWQG